jgi:hypothetical protein
MLISNLSKIVNSINIIPGEVFRQFLIFKGSSHIRMNGFGGLLSAGSIRVDSSWCVLGQDSQGDEREDTEYLFHLLL